jgi:hypothetical protein
MVRLLGTRGRIGWEIDFWTDDYFSDPMATPARQ